MWDEEYEIEVDYIKHTTVKALLCVIDGDEVWIPRSQIVSSDAWNKGESGYMTVTAWLAKEEGWL